MTRNFFFEVIASAPLLDGHCAVQVSVWVLERANHTPERVAHVERLDNIVPALSCFRVQLRPRVKTKHDCIGFLCSQCQHKHALSACRDGEATGVLRSHQFFEQRPHFDPGVQVRVCFAAWTTRLVSDPMGFLAFRVAVIGHFAAATLLELGGDHTAVVAGHGELGQVFLGQHGRLEWSVHRARHWLRGKKCLDRTKN